MLDALLEEAHRLAAGGQIRQAKNLYMRICQLAPQNPGYWLRLAELNYDLDEYRECLQGLEHVLRLDSHNPAALLLASAAMLGLGHYAQTVQLADQVLSYQDGNHLAALLNKSMALLRLERFEDTLATVDATLILDDHQPVAYSTRGSALFGLGRHEEALAAFGQALALRPQYAVALINQAAVLRALQRPVEALAAVDAALATCPDSSSALLNRAAILLDLKRYEEALATLDQLLAKQPDHAKALQNRGLALLYLSRYREALDTANVLRTGKHSAVDIMLVAGETLLQQGQSAQALLWIDQGLAWYPDHPSLLRGRVAILLDQERYHSALEVAERLLAVAKDHSHLSMIAVVAAFNANGRFQDALALLDSLPASIQSEWQFHAKRGETLALLDRFEEARIEFAAADCTDSHAFRSLYHDGSAQVRPVDSMPLPVTPELIRVGFEFRRLEHADWQDYENRIAMIQRLIDQSLSRDQPSPLLPFRALFLPISSALRLAIARREAEWIEKLLSTTQNGFNEVGKSNREIINTARLRIGYISADFRDHPTAHLIRSLFRCHDHQRFEVYVYSLCKDDGSAYYRQIRDNTEHFIDLSTVGNADAVRQIQSDGINILIDLMGYTNFARPEIFVLRPAPVQVSWLGFPGSSGARFIDYLLADSVVLPTDQTGFYTEQPVWLPECYQVNDCWQEIAGTGISRTDCGLPERGFIFCSFNQIQKLEPKMFRIWMRILEQVPDAVLWLYCKSEEAPDRLRQQAAIHGIASERLIFAGYLPKAQHLERHQLADLFLDTYIYNAHTTASDALWAGVPVLTCIGEAFPARVAASLLHAIGLPELITHSLDEYEQLAVRLATHPEELSMLKKKLAENRLRKPLFNTERFARHLERAYDLMWARHTQGLQPAPLHVPPLSSTCL